MLALRARADGKGAAMTHVTVRPFADADVAPAGELLAARHASLRAVEPAFDEAFERADAASREITSLLETEGATGHAAVRDGSLVAFLVGVHRDDSTWGPNVWVDAAGHAARDAEAIRDLYAAAAAGWVEAGRTSHYAIVPASDPVAVDAWFRLGFGHQHVHAVREAPAEGELSPSSEGLVVRRAVRDDLDVLARLDVALPEHQTLSPVFSRLDVPTVEAMRAEWEEEWDDPRFTVLVAEHGGHVVGSAIGCPIEVSPSHRGLLCPPGAGFLGFAAVSPESRGLGAGRALGEAVLEWARADGRAWVVTDWRMTNLLASRAWPRLGFRPTFYRLHRAIDL